MLFVLGISAWLTIGDRSTTNTSSCVMPMHATELSSVGGHDVFSERVLLVNLVSSFTHSGDDSCKTFTDVVWLEG